MIVHAIRPSTVQQPTDHYTIKAGATHIATFGHSWNGWNTAFAAGWTSPDQTITPLGFKLPGNDSYAWRDDQKTIRRICLQGYSLSLFDIYFHCADSGSGTMFRLDCRGSSADPTGFSTTQSWTAWNGPASGLVLTQSQWYDVTIDIGDTEVIATIVGVIQGVVGSGTSLMQNNVGTIRTSFASQGTAMGLQGDGGGFYSYVRHLTIND